MKKKFELPYGKDKIPFLIEEKDLEGVLLSQLVYYKPHKEATQLVKEAMENPIESPRLRELASGKRRITIISSDHTRPVPSHIIMPLLLEEIRSGNPEAEITILIATGCHRGTTDKELRAKFGSKIFDHEKIVIHDCDDMEQMVYLGKLPSGGDFYVNKIAAQAELLVAEGFIEPHFFAGFSGGRKSVLPGVASRASVMYNHNSAFIAHPLARTGILEGNPIHKDMIFAAKKAGLAYIVNVVIDAEHNPIYAVAGDCEAAHLQGVQFLQERTHVEPIIADVVISTNAGYPLDQNIYQSVKGMTAAEASVKQNGVIIMVAKALDGHGGQAFYETFRDEKNLGRMLEKFLARKPEETIVDQWQSQIFARVLMKATVIFVSSCPSQLVEDMHMVPAIDLEEAMEKAKQILQKDDLTVTIIPDGVSVIVG